jgi:hypothetical protein
MEWNQHSAKRHALNSVFFVQPSMRSCVKFAQPRVMLDLMSDGASFATYQHKVTLVQIGSLFDFEKANIYEKAKGSTYTEPCIIDSGMFFQEAMGGGSAEMKQRKSGCAFSCTTSSSRSSFGTHDCIKWQFCNIT